MAKKKSKAGVEELEDDDELDLEDLDEEADDEEVDEADDDEEEEDEDEPKTKKKTKKAKKSSKKKESDTIGSSELAEALGTDGRNLRVMLRDKGVEKNENNRYEWDSVDDALEALGFDDLEEAKDALKAARDKRLEKLKADNAKKKKASSSDDEDDDDTDEDEEEEAPKKKTKKAPSKDKKKKAKK